MNTLQNHKIIAIHQPNFFPWLGYFDKINRSDVFVYLDHTLNNPRTASWYKRVKILLNGQEYWLSLAIQSKEQVFIPIYEMQIDKALFQKEKHLKTLEQNYKKYPYFEQIFPLLESYYQHESIFLADRNINFINSVCQELDITTPKIRSSSLNCEKNSTDLLIEIAKKTTSKTYMAGGGAGGYQEDEKFLEAGINLMYQNFQHPIYPQKSQENFVRGLSILDALMNVGFKGIKQLLKINER